MTTTYAEGKKVSFFFFLEIRLLLNDRHIRPGQPLHNFIDPVDLLHRLLV